MQSSIWNDIRENFSRKDDILARLILINIAVFAGLTLTYVMLFLFNAAPPGFDHFIQTVSRKWLGVPADAAQLLRRPWTLVTYMFVHAGIFHLLFNMVCFYWMGMILKGYTGSRHILPLYLIGGLCGALLFVLAYNLFPVFSPGIPLASCIGASAGVLALVVGTASLVPHHTVFLLLIGPVRVKYIALALVFIDILNIPTGNAGGHIAHLGGALAGYLYILGLKRGHDPGAWVHRALEALVTAFSFKKSAAGTGSASGRRKTTRSPRAVNKDELVDRILDKIAQSGYESLSKEEKEFLFRASKENES